MSALAGPGGWPLTDEQARAVEDRAGRLLLSANAGSGKTTVLAERFVRAVLVDGTPASRLLAITFTDKAAGELRARLRARLIELGHREATRDMEAAWVSTIHGFCARVLRTHPVAAGLDPRFTVLDEATARALRARAWEQALAGLLAQDATDDALQVVAAYGPDALSAAIAGVHDELRSRGQTVPRLPPVTVRGEVGDAIERLRAAAPVVRGELAAVAKPGVTVTGALAMLEVCEVLLGGELDGDALRRLGAFSLSRQANALKTDACDAFRSAVIAVEEARVDGLACEVWGVLGTLLDHYSARYAQAKRARSALDYDDLELGVRDLFDAQPALAGAYAERFDRVMVDEFQDTNPLQIAIVQRLDRGNVFCVGDALQSIYGFRHADVEVFRARRAEHDAVGEAATLAVNWRSRPELLRTINALFAPAHPDYVALEPGRQDPVDPAAPRTELLLVDAAWNDDDLVDPIVAERVAAGMPSARRSQHVQARAVARRVRALVDEEGVVPGDVAVLLRAATEMHVYERALELEGLPTLASGGRGFWARQQVQDLTSYLAALANPRDALALLSVLASPLAGLSGDALALIAMTARERRVTPWDAIAGATLAGLGARDATRLEAFVARFRAERLVAPRLALDELIARAARDTGYDLQVLRLPGGRRRMANVHKLERLAAAYEVANGRDVRGFIDHARAELEAEAREPDAPIDPGDSSAVALMTIHAAKGLEFGVVVVADLGRQRSAQSPQVLVDGVRGGLRLVEPDLKRSNAFAFAELVAAQRARDEAEERRILHVAVTRAEERLILSGVAAIGEDATWAGDSATAPPLALIGPLLDPELPALLTDRAEVLYDEQRADGVLRMRVTRVGVADAGTTLGIEAAPGQLELAIDGGTPTAPALALALAVPADADCALTHDMAVRRDNRPHVAPPGAISYSQLAAYARCAYRHYLERVLHLPRDEDDRGPGAAVGLDARIRGSILHEVMETLNLDDPQAPADERLDTLAERYEVTLTDDDRDDLRGLVAAFASSPLRARMSAARELRREEGFVFGLGPTMVNGFVDVRAREDDGAALVVDYKTDRVVPGTDLEAYVTRDYDAQRRIYALAELRAGAPAVEVVHLFLQRPDEPATACYTAADIAALEDGLLRDAGPLLRGEFPVTAAPNAFTCEGCPGRGTLCPHPRAETEVPLVEA